MKPEFLFRGEFQRNDKYCDVYHFFKPTQRYIYDFDEEMKEDGWIQYDTDQDAHYFGVWVNKKKMMILSYTEGDHYLNICHDVESFNKQIKEINKFYGEGFICKTFSEDGCVTYTQDRNKFFIKEAS